jgi:muconolactone delta-isomerase
MKFLVRTEPKHQAPPEMVPGMIDGLIAWAEANEDKLDSIWSLAGKQGGGGIVSVKSLEELDQLMITFPFGPFYEIAIDPIVELGHSMDRVKTHVSNMLAQMNQ